MPTNLQLLARLEAIEAAIASGVSSVSFDGKRTDFRSVSDLLRVRDGILAQLGILTTVRHTVGAYDSGTGPLPRGVGPWDQDRQ